MRKREEADRVIYCDRGFFPIYYGFCPSEAAWKREMKRLGMCGAPYPSDDANATVIDSDKVDGVTVLVTVSEKVEAMAAVKTMAVIAHESVHVWQTIRKQMDESDPSPEFEAYAIQDIVLRLGAAYERSRRPKWARK
jgi:hypothetical protein